MARTITALYLDDHNSMKVATLDQPLEKLISDSIQNTKQGIIAVLPPELAQKIINEIAEATNELAVAGNLPVVLTSPNVRLASRRLIAHVLPKVAVISFNELIPNIEIESIKTVRMPDEN
jgi:flagellar biosynthesis protein FlhA